MEGNLSTIERINLFMTSVKLIDKLFFTKNLALLMRSGIPLTKSLESLHEQTDNIKLKHILKHLLMQIEKGKSLADSLAKHPKVFSDIFVNMIRAGEESGKMEDVLNTLTIQLYKEHDLKSKIKGALAYPVVVLIAMVSITTGLIVFVIPKLSVMFLQSGIELPLPTKILISVSNILTEYSLFAIIGGVGFIFGFLQFRKTTTGKKILHKAVLKLPVIKTLAVKVNLARSSRSLASLLKTDIPVVQTFVIASSVIANYYYKAALLDVSEKLKSGSSIHTCLQKHKKLFPATIMQMVAVGEETGSLDEMLLEVAKFYEEDLDTILKNLPALLEPVLILLLGVTVGGIALAIMLPIYSYTRSAM